MGKGPLHDYKIKNSLQFINLNNPVKCLTILHTVKYLKILGLLKKSV